MTIKDFVFYSATYVDENERAVELKAELLFSGHFSQIPLDIRPGHLLIW